MSKLTWSDIRYFKPHEFDSGGSPGSGERHMNLEFVALLDKLRHAWGYPMVISSGYRTPGHNRTIGGAANSVHLLGRAADIRAEREKAYKLLEIAIKMDVFTGIGISQKGKGSSRFIHLDDLAKGENNKVPRPMLWSY